MQDALAQASAAIGDDPTIRAILADVCARTEMGFAAVARVTDTRWIACQVLDRIEFGLVPGEELELATTICDEIRGHGREVVIDHVGADPAWRTHHTPVLYGFQSYVSLPIRLEDGSFFGTLCAIDPHPRNLSNQELMAALRAYAAQISVIVSGKLRHVARSDDRDE